MLIYDSKQFVFTLTSSFVEKFGYYMHLKSSGATK